MLPRAFLLLVAFAFTACGSSVERPGDAASDSAIGLDAGDARLDARPDDAGDAGDARVDAPVGDCDGLNEPDCAGRAGCVPVYQDRCCPACEPELGCADCADVRFLACRPMSACDTDTCAILSSFWCAGISPVCPDRFEGPGECALTPGCVRATEPGCTERCETICTPVLPDICAPAACEEEPPDCPPGERPAVRDGCYLGLCIPNDVCDP